MIYGALGLGGFSGADRAFYNSDPSLKKPANIFAPGPITAATGAPYADVAAATNKFMTGEAAAPYIANLPDYQSMLKTATGTAGAQLRGEVPQDVINQIVQGGAERGVATGMPGSPNANAAWLRALGLTSIGQQQAGAQNLHSLIADTPVPQLFNPASLFVPERLGMMELNASRLGQGSVPRPSYGGYSLPFSSPSAPASPFTLTPQAQTATQQGRIPADENDWLRILGEDMLPNIGEDWANPNAPIYQPAGDAGPSDFSDWWDVP